MDKETSETVTIVVKSPYQHFSDQVIDCPTEWTVLKLKEEISAMHPNHPKTNEQKLIYWGKLLQNNLSLKDTLRIYEEGQANHTVHLVIKSDQVLQSNLAGDNVRRRNVSLSGNQQQSTSASSSQQQQFSQSVPTSGVGYSNTYWPWMPVNNNTTIPTLNMPFYQTNNMMNNNNNINNADTHNNIYMQHLNYMQHQYNQYINQYMQMMAYRGVHPTTPLIHPQHISTQQAAPVVNNNVNNNNNDNADEDNRPRDWIDLFYISVRALFFLSILCFYSSPFRFLVVLTIGISVYLYQSGWLRRTGPAVLIGDNNRHINNNNNNTPNNNIENNNTNRPESNADSATNTLNENAENVEQQNRDTTQTTTPDPNETTVQDEEDQPTFLHLSWSIVINFFASLLPDQPNTLI